MDTYSLIAKLAKCSECYFVKTTYSLTEYKLRRYFYLGHEYSMYVPPSLRTLSCNKNHQADVTGIRIIGKIVKKNKPEEINSIVPIILKVKKEDKIHDDKHLVFALAVCAGFELNQCVKMVADAYSAILAVCTDGLKLLMFVKSYKTAISLLCKEGYLSKEKSGFPKQFRIALSKWYLNRDPFLVAEQIVRHKSYGGWSHKKVMKLIHIHSDEPSYRMIILYVIYGINVIEEQFGTKLDFQMVDENEPFKNKQLKFVYNYFKTVHDLKKMDEITLRNAIESNCLGKQFEIIPENMLLSSKVLIALIKNLPMKKILELTFLFAKRRVFSSVSRNNGLWEYILSFTNPVHLQQSRIHPIEPFIEYVKYSRTSLNILKFQNINSKKQDKKIDLPKDKLNVIIEIKNLQSNDPSSEVVEKTSNASFENENTFQSVVKDDKTVVQASTSKNQSENINLSLKDSKSKLKSTSSATSKDDLLEQKSDVDNVAQNQSKSNMIFSKPLPRLEEEILKFLSDGLVKKSLENLKPTGHPIIITYDSRMYLLTKRCACTNLLNVHEAITLIILSLIHPEKLSDKPCIRSLDGSEEEGNKEVEIDYEQPMTFNSLDSILFKPTLGNILNEKDVPNVNPLSTINWAIANKQNYDIFVFLGSHKMNLKNIKEAKKNYQLFSKKPVKIIVCCLNGMHADQSYVYRQNMLFIAGFDKNIGKIINSYINNEF